jgi:broad specificity phosphatase PhoE
LLHQRNVALSQSGGPDDARLVFIRHAESDCGERLCGCYDPPLTSRGFSQVALLRESGALNPPVAAIYSSPLRRSLATAEAAPADNAEIVDDLREICCGTLDGRPISEVTSEYRELWERNLAQAEDDFRWPGGESYREFRARVLARINSIAARNRGERVLLFTHAGVINQVIGVIRGLRPAQWEPFRPGHASITEVEWSGDSGRLLVFDDRCHLRGAAGVR